MIPSITKIFEKDFPGWEFPRGLLWGVAGADPDSGLQRRKYLAEVVLEVQESAVPGRLPDHLQAQGFFLVNNRQVEKTAEGGGETNNENGTTGVRTPTRPPPPPGARRARARVTRGCRKPGLSAAGAFRARGSRLSLAPLQGLSALPAAPRRGPARRLPAGSTSCPVLSLPRPPAAAVSGPRPPTPGLRPPAPAYVSPSSVSCCAQAGGSRGCRRMPSSSCTSCRYSSSFMESRPLSWRSSSGKPPGRSFFACS